MGAVYCAETWVPSYQSALRNIPEKRVREAHRDGGLNSRISIELSGSFLSAIHSVVDSDCVQFSGHDFEVLFFTLFVLTVETFRTMHADICIDMYRCVWLIFI